MEIKIEDIKYLEVIEIPKLQRSLERIYNKYEAIVTDHHLDKDEVIPFIEKALNEGNGMIIEPEHMGYYVTVWRNI